MRFLFSIFCLVGISTQSWATTPPPVLGRVIGGVGENGETQPGASKRCFVYPTQIVIQNYDSTTGKNESFTQPSNLTTSYLKQLAATVNKAANARETAAAHVRETTPHVYYFAYGTNADGTPSARVRLYFDGSRMLKRDGTEAASLLQVIEHLCPHR